jgi:hypothetical protein
MESAKRRSVQMKKILALASTLVLVSTLALSISMPVLACHPNTDVGITISVLTPVAPGTDVTLTITEANVGDEALTGVYVELFENGTLIATLDATTASGDAGITGTLDIGETWTWGHTVTVSATATYTVIGHGMSPGLGVDVTYENGYELERDCIEITVEENGGGEGFTPGFWKNHVRCWTGYDPDDSFDDIFGTSTGLTLYEAVWLRGNNVNSLIRHAVAGILNAAHPNVSYDLTVDEVIAIVQDAFADGSRDAIRAAKLELEAFNELEGDITS